MLLHLKYFGLLAEVTQCSEENLTFSGTTVLELKKLLNEKYKTLEQKRYQIAQNNELVNDEALILETEIALMPPFAGG